MAEQIGSGFGLGAIDLGDLHLRNLARPVRVFALRVQTMPLRLVGDALAGSEPRPSIAVLPFRKHQTDPEENYFADGIVDVIINALASLKELFVISRGSTLGYSGATIDARVIGRELGVRYVLYGSVRRSRGRIRIGTELTDTETGTIVRSDQYDGDLAELFEVQDRIATNVVKTIAPNVRERELARAMRKHPQNMTAYDLVLQALDFLYRMDKESFARARGLLQQAITHDPGYAPAYSYTAIGISCASAKSGRRTLWRTRKRAPSTPRRRSSATPMMRWRSRSMAMCNHFCSSATTEPFRISTVRWRPARVRPWHGA